MGIYDLVPRNGITGPLMGHLCKLAPHLCIAMQEGFFDWDGKIDNASRVADKQAHSPSGSGWRNLVHYGQIIKAKQFQRYDYGSEGNMKEYNSATPPKYDLSAIPVKMLILSGDVDQLGDKTDVDWLLDESQSGLKSDLVVFTKVLHFGHVSFMMAQDMSYVQDVIKVIKPTAEETLY